MSLKRRVTSGGGPASIEPGTYPAAIVAIIELGQHLTQYEERRPTMKPQVLLGFEIPKGPGNKTGNLVLIQKMTFSYHESANLRKWIEAITSTQLDDDSDYDLTELIDKPCQVTIALNSAKFPYIEGVTSLRKGDKPPKGLHKGVVWSLDDYHQTRKIELPKWLPTLFGRAVEDVIMESAEIRAMRPKAQFRTQQNNDEIPF